MSTDNMVRHERALMRTQFGQELRKKFKQRPTAIGTTSDSWLGSDFAEWCTTSPIAFVDHVFDLFDGKPFHDHIRDELTTRPN